MQRTASAAMRQDRGATIGGGFAPRAASTYIGQPRAASPAVRQDRGATISPTMAPRTSSTYIGQPNVARAQSQQPQRSSSCLIRTSQQQAQAMSSPFAAQRASSVGVRSGAALQPGMSKSLTLPMPTSATQRQSSAGVLQRTPSLYARRPAESLAQTPAPAPLAPTPRHDQTSYYNNVKKHGAQPPGSILEPAEEPSPFVSPSLSIAAPTASDTMAASGPVCVYDPAAKGCGVYGADLGMPNDAKGRAYPRQRKSKGGYYCC